MASIVSVDPTIPGKAEQPSPKLPPFPTRLLIADDEHLVGAGLANNLSELGYEVVAAASDGEEAVQLCASRHPDLALLDVRMPGRDGISAAEAIYQQCCIPSVIVSAYSDPEYVDRANRTGVFGYLLKPVTQDQLRVGLRIAWGRFLDVASRDSEIHALKERLQGRKIVEQAKWIIVKRKNLSEPEAMKTLQRQARNTRRTLVDVARSVLENEDLFNAAS